MVLLFWYESKTLDQVDFDLPEVLPVNSAGLVRVHLASPCPSGCITLWIAAWLRHGFSDTSFMARCSNSMRVSRKHSWNLCILACSCK